MGTSENGELDENGDGSAIDEIGIWLAVGAGIGTAFGAAFSTQFDDE